MATFVLIHGAWHGRWCWERIIPLLEEQGHRVIAPDLPGMGGDSTPLQDVTLDLWARFVADLVKEQDEKVILVGHSRGGVVISQAAEYYSDNIHGLIYLCAFLIPSGKTLWEILQEEPRSPDRPQDLVLSSDKRTSTVTEEAVLDTFYNATAADWVERAVKQVGPEPMISFTTPLALTESHFNQVPRAYIECLQDRGIPLPLQRRMQAELPCKHVVSLDTDHSPFYSAPKELVEQLITLAVKLIEEEK